MISEFIREQKRYTRDNLKSIFCCSDADIIRIIKKLKGYGILKTVKNTKEQLNMSDLVDEDIEVSDEDESFNKYLYVFTYVGIIIVEGRVLKCNPKYLLKTSNHTEELKQVIKVLQRYNSNEQIIRMYNDDGRTITFNRIAVMTFLLNDYFENGIYTNTEDIIETNGSGEIHWDRTINETYPIISKNRPYYVELKTKRRINDETDFFKRLHECILTSCTNELKEADLIELLDIEGVDLSDEYLDDLGDEDYILYRLEKEMNVQFNTRKQMVLRTIEALVENNGTIADIDSFSMFGTNSFNLVWEKACAEVMDNKLYTPINALGLDDVKIPEGAKYSVSDKLISVIDKPQWYEYTEGKLEFEKEANKTLIPDLISIYHNDEGCDFLILDAKYYTVQLEKSKELRGQPGVSDVTKQYLYQLAYEKFVKVNKFNRVKNYFLMPTEEDGAEGAIKKRFVKMNMLTALGLENIQVIQLAAKKVYKHYLNGTKIDFKELDL